ncbi:hypothetical protein F2Q69_00054277 [Brassica cretica]|uniref:C2 domain-containing protein n=1 Tax=Brassica cretica TaxID=69181 RepID=A0A8S9N630_BRACR|nr:hypothetical protein F2Q69_00054277 [Brassica cretica]
MVGVGGTTSAASGYASPNDAVDYYLKSRGFNASSLRSSEVVLNSLNPKWIKKLTLSYQLELVQTLLFKTQGRRYIPIISLCAGGVSFQMLKIDEQQFLGEATCTLSEMDFQS